MSGMSFFIVFLLIPACIFVIDLFFRLENLFYKRFRRPKGHRREFKGKDTEFEIETQRW